MPRNGSGTYSLVSGNPVVTGTTISSATHNTTMSDIATALTASLARDGQTTPSANLPMGAYKHTGVGASNATTDYARTDQVQNGAFTELASVAGTDTITGSATPTPAAYAAGQMFAFIAAATNTGAATLNVSSLGAKAITKKGTTALAAGDIISGAVHVVRYDGTQFQLLNIGALIDSAETDASGYGFFIDEDTMATDSATKVPSQQSVKAYVDDYVLPFVSAEQTISSAGSLTIAHGLGSSPSLVQCRLICKTAELNYSVDDEVIVADHGQASSAANTFGLSLVPDATNVNIRFGSAATPILLSDKTTGSLTAVTNANWKLIVRAWK